MSRPCLRSGAAPVRFSSRTTAAKSLPMPEEFPEQHSRSFTACFETLLCLYFDPVLSSPATGLSPDINGKHVYQTQPCFFATELMASAGLTLTERRLLHETTWISQPFSTQALLRVFDAIDKSSFFPPPSSLLSRCTLPVPRGIPHCPGLAPCALFSLVSIIK